MLKEEMPIRLAMSLAMDTEALEAYAQLSKRKKQSIIKKSMSIQNRAEMDRFVDKIHGNYSN